MAELAWNQPPASVTDPELRRLLDDLIKVARMLKLVGNNIGIYSGSGSPEGVITANVGSLYLRTDAATALWVKQTGTGATGWVAK